MAALCTARAEPFTTSSTLQRGERPVEPVSAPAGNATAAGQPTGSVAGGRLPEWAARITEAFAGLVDVIERLAEAGCVEHAVAITMNAIVAVSLAATRRLRFICEPLLKYAGCASTAHGVVRCEPKSWPGKLTSPGHDYDVLSIVFRCGPTKGRAAGRRGSVLRSCRTRHGRGRVGAIGRSERVCRLAGRSPGR